MGGCTPGFAERVHEAVRLFTCWAFWTAKFIKRSTTKCVWRRDISPRYVVNHMYSPTHSTMGSPQELGVFFLGKDAWNFLLGIGES